MEVMHIRVTSYNIHGCIGASRVADPYKVADIIKETGADLIALQEVDSEKPISGAPNQAKILAGRLDFYYRYYPIESPGRRIFGLAVLSRYPFISSRFQMLPSLHPELKPRKRGMIQATIDAPVGRIRVVNTHLSVFKLERLLQLGVVLNDETLKAALDKPAILCGDLNAGPSSRTYRELSMHFSDVQTARKMTISPQPTFHAKIPIFRIDHIFVSHHFTIMDAKVLRTFHTVTASDHLPITADLEVPSRAPLRGD